MNLWFLWPSPDGEGGPAHAGGRGEKIPIYLKYYLFFKLQIIGLNGMVKTIPYVWCWCGRGVKTKAYAQSMASLDQTPRVSRENDILPYF